MNPNPVSINYDGKTVTIGKEVNWNLFVHLSKIVVASLRDFYTREDSFEAIPCSFLPDPFNTTDQDMEDGEAAYKLSLAKIIFAFAILASDDGVCDEGEEEIVEDGLLEFAAHFQSLWN